MRRITMFLSFILILSSSVRSQVAPDIRQLDAYFTKALHDWNVPGMAVAIVRNDTVLLAKGYGVRAMGTSDPVDEHTLFAIASNTKAFTAAALAMLFDEHKIDWDDRVQQYLPFFALYDPYVSADVRIRDILSHRVGLRTFGGDLLWYGTSYDREEVVRRARCLKQAYPFRAGYGYSNIMFITAGLVVEKASGMPWEQFIRSRILQPLGMTHTVLSVKDLRGITNVAQPHGDYSGTLKRYPWYGWDNVAPAGGIISCAADLAQWLRLQLGRGVHGVDTLYADFDSRLMWTPHANFIVGKGSRDRNPYTNFRGYGLGWSLSDYRGALLADHGGGYDGMFSHTTLVPDLKLGVVILTNSMTGISDALAMKVVDAYLGAPDRDWSAEGLKQEREGRERQRIQRSKADSVRVLNTKPSLPLERYAGTYGGTMYGDAVVSVEKGVLAVKFLPDPDLTGDLAHWQYDVFSVHWRKDSPWFGDGKVQFVLDQRGDVDEMRINVPNNDFWFDELEFKKKN